MSRFTIPKIPFRPLTMITQDYLFHSRLTARDTLPKSQIFHYPKSVQSNSYFFFWLGQPKPFWAKKFQDNPNMTKALSFDRNFPSLGQSETLWTKNPQTSPNLIKTLFLWQEYHMKHLWSKRACQESSCCCNTSSQHLLQSRFLT